MAAFYVNNGSTKFRVAASPTTLVAKGLVGYWTLDGNDTSWGTGITNDMSGQGNHGQLISMSTTTTPVVGQIGQALKFDGAASVVSIGASKFNFLKTSAFSGCAWFRTSLLTTDQILTDYNKGTSPGWMLNVNNTASTFVNFAVVNAAGGAGVFVRGSTVVTDNKWHHTCFTYDGTVTTAGTKLYVDGSAETLTNVLADSDPGVLVDSGTFIGKRGDSTGLFSGNIDDVRLYNRVLSPSEVTLLYNGGVARLAASPTLISKGLIGYYTFDGNDTHWNTNLTDDLSGNGNTTRMTGMSTTTTPIAGKIGQGFNFDGVTANVKANTPDIPGEGSVVAWIKMAVAPGATRAIFANVVDNTHDDFIFYILNGNKVSAVWGNTTILTSTGTVTTGPWHQVVMTRSGSAGAWSTSIYIDGVFDSSTSSAVDPSGGAPFAQVGARNLNQLFRGIIDDVRVYNRALSPAEITLLYTSTR